MKIYCVTLLRLKASWEMSKILQQSDQNSPRKSCFSSSLMYTSRQAENTLVSATALKCAQCRVQGSWSEVAAMTTSILSQKSNHQPSVPVRYLLLQNQPSMGDSLYVYKKPNQTKVTTAEETPNTSAQQAPPTSLQRELVQRVHLTHSGFIFINWSFEALIIYWPYHCSDELSDEQLLLWGIIPSPRVNSLLSPCLI